MIVNTPLNWQWQKVTRKNKHTTHGTQNIWFTYLRNNSKLEIYNSTEQSH